MKFSRIHWKPHETWEREREEKKLKVVVLFRLEIREPHCLIYIQSTKKNGTLLWCKLSRQFLNFPFPHHRIFIFIFHKIFDFWWYGIYSMGGGMKRRETHHFSAVYKIILKPGEGEKIFRCFHADELRMWFVWLFQLSKIEMTKMTMMIYQKYDDEINTGCLSNIGYLTTFQFN